MRLISALLFLTMFVPLSLGQDVVGADTVEGLKEANKIKNDGDRVHFAKKLSGEWEKVDEKTRKDALKQMKATLKTKETSVRVQLVEFIGTLGGGEKNKDADAATRVLTDEFKDAEEDLTYFHAVLMAVGKLGTEKGADALLKMLRFKDFDVIASAVVSLGQYSGAELELRGTIVQEIIKAYTSVASPAQDPRNSEAQRRLAKVDKPMEQTLKNLTKATDVSGVQGWTTWWNNIGKRSKDW
jgi:hypothetical protein